MMCVLMTDLTSCVNMTRFILIILTDSFIFDGKVNVRFKRVFLRDLRVFSYFEHFKIPIFFSISIARTSKPFDITRIEQKSTSLSEKNFASF